MDRELMLFDSTGLETASEAVLFCKEHLESRGLYNLANKLEGLVPMTTAEIGRIVVHVLTDIQPQVHGQTAEYIRWALDSVRGAVSPRVRTAA